MTPAGNGLEAPQSFAALLAWATPYRFGKNVCKAPAGASAPGFCTRQRSGRATKGPRALKAGIWGGGGAICCRRRHTAPARAPSSLNKEHKVKKPSIHAGSRGGGR